jgi:hypothetical protein
MAGHRVQRADTGVAASGGLGDKVQISQLLGYSGSMVSAAPGNEKGNVAHRASGVTTIVERRVTQRRSSTVGAPGELWWLASGSTAMGSGGEGEDGVDLAGK